MGPAIAPPRSLGTWLQSHRASAHAEHQSIKLGFWPTRRVLGVHVTMNGMRFRRLFGFEYLLIGESPCVQTCPNTCVRRHGWALLGFEHLLSHVYPALRFPIARVWSWNHIGSLLRSFCQACLWILCMHKLRCYSKTLCCHM